MCADVCSSGGLRSLLFDATTSHSIIRRSSAGHAHLALAMKLQGGRSQCFGNILVGREFHQVGRRKPRKQVQATRRAEFSDC